MPLRRDEVLLTVLAKAAGEPLTPVQVQKALFLADDKAQSAFRNRYDFQPYDYGPFDRQVYVDAESLSASGLVRIGRDPRGWNTYAATDDGIARAEAIRGRLTKSENGMLARIVRVVQSLSFTELVSAIYRRYPHMKERSIFRD